MEKFVVSARKYRPVTFDSVVGQSHITTTLRNAIKTEHLAQAFLFCGPRGVGKTTCARILAKTINCKNVSEDIEPCNQCVSCKNFAENASFNIHELDAASNNSVEDIRNLIDQVRFPPQDGKYKVYIIDEVHMLSQAAFNAFLKTLEEPPSYAIFILATTEKHKILPTILSRCQIFDFNRIKIKDMTDHLMHIARKEGVEVEEEAMELIAQKADGGLRDALSMFDLNVTFSEDNKLTYAEVLENLHVLDHDYYFQICEALFQGDLSKTLLLFDEILSKGFDGHQFVVGLNTHLRNVLVGQDPSTIKLMEVSASVQERFAQQAKALDRSFLMSCLSIGSQLDLHYKQAKNQRLHVEIGLMKMAHVPHVLQLHALPEEKPVRVEERTVSYKIEPVKEKPKSSKSTLLDLEKQLFKKKGADQVQEEKQVEPDQKLDLNKENVKKLLLDYEKKVQKQTERLVLRGDFELHGNHISLQVMNQTMQSTFMEMKQALLDYLRNYTGTPELQIDALVTAEVKAMKPRTEQEKYEAMVKQNPILEDLKRDLGLDLVY